MIVFENKGVIDTRFITTFGVSAKENTNPIGYFGTGLKYAIAVLLREHQSITILAGNEVLNFDTELVELRGKEFQVIRMNGKELPFTTELGKNWKMWQAFRELYCNATDEGGSIYESDEYPTHAVDKTTIIVDGHAFAQEYQERDKVILNREIIIPNPICDICLGGNNAIYYRGVRALEPKKPTMFTYNIQNKVDITEDRTIKYEWEAQCNMVSAIFFMDVARMEQVLLAEAAYYESSINFDCGLPPSERFLDVVADLYRKKGDKVNKTAITLYERKRKSILTGLPVILTDVEQKMLDKAKDFVTKLVCSPVDDYQIVVVEMSPGTLGCVKDHIIFINRYCFRFGGTKLVTSTLLEEYLHACYGWEDFSREMQNYLFDMVISQGEQIRGEPL